MDYEVIKRKDVVEKLVETGIVTDAIISVLPALEQKVAEQFYDKTAEIVSETLENGNRFEIKDVALLVPFQSGHKLSGEYLGANPSGQKNRVKVVPRKAFEDKFQKVDLTTDK